MATMSPDGRRTGEVRQDLAAVVEGLSATPVRVPLAQAQDALAQHGAIVVPSPSPAPAALVQVAAAALGTGLRHVFPIRPRQADQGPLLALHNDGAYVNADLHGQIVKLRDPDEDYVLQRVDVPAPEGGQSILVDGYRMLERIEQHLPELHAFLTGVDVDFFGSWQTPPRGVPATPLLRRMVEYTRAGRRVVRASDYAAPAPRDPHAQRHHELLDDYADVIATVTEAATGFDLAGDEVLIVDNYRFLHGRTPFTGHREIHVLTVLSDQAWSVW